MSKHSSYYAKHKILTASLVVSAVILGFFIGIAPTVEIHQQHKAPIKTPPSSQIPPAASYAELHTQRISPNREWKNTLSQLSLQTSDPLQISQDINLETIQKQRQGNRAYEGAPPMVPHPITEQSSKNCLVCHQKSVVISDNPQKIRVSPAVHHPHYTNCIQCHLEQKNTDLQPDILRTDIAVHQSNSFSGDPVAQRGIRLAPQTPPIIPHRVQMRKNCLACHGDDAPQAMRSDHTFQDENNCLSCHSAENARAHADRSLLRAYDGAPPVIPHRIEQQSSSSCITCHNTDSIQNALAAPQTLGKSRSAPSHPFMTNCIQCHLPAENLDILNPLAPDVSARNSFAGQQAPQGGSRAWRGAPPVLPHRVHMRENCLECHGTQPNSNKGIIRSSHPERTNCLQCHLPQDNIHP